MEPSTHPRRRVLLGATGTFAAGLPAVGTAAADRSFAAGDRVRSTVNLSVRSGAGTDNARKEVVTTGATGRVTDDAPVDTESYTWYRIEWDSGVTGWSVEQYLSPTETPEFASEDRVRSTVALSVRAGPTTDEDRVDVVDPGAMGTVSDRDPVSGSQYRWRHVEWDSGSSGWSASTYLQSLTPTESRFAPGQTVSTPGTVVDGYRAPAPSASSVEFWPNTTGVVLADEPIAVDGEAWVRVDTGVGVPAWFPESSLSA